MQRNKRRNERKESDMGHSYYNYTKEELVGNDPKLPGHCYGG